MKMKTSTRTTTTMRRYRTEKSVTEKSVSRVLWPLEAPPMCPRPTAGENSTAYTRKKTRRMACSLPLSVSNELNEPTSSQYAPFSHKIALFSFFGGADAKKKREHHPERTWTAEAPSPNFAHFGVRERAKRRL